MTENQAEKRPTPDECPGAVDYGHHGSERCVWCGLERGSGAAQ